MRFEDKKFAGVLIFACILFVISVDFCDADKNKHKTKATKHDNKDEHHQHHKKNSTHDHHHNNTASHNANSNHSVHADHAPDIGWSLHNNQGQQAHQPNPNGYALQHHHEGHGTHATHPNVQQHPQPSAPNQPSQDSGPSALGAGLGGLALGAVGGAAGGYLISNALNKDEKTEEKPADNETTLITETTLSALVSENSTEISGISETTTISSESTTVAAETTIEPLSAAPQNISASAVLDAPKEEQKATDAPVATAEIGKGKNDCGNKSLSAFLFAAFVVVNFVVKF